MAAETAGKYLRASDAARATTGFSHAPTQHDSRVTDVWHVIDMRA